MTGRFRVMLTGVCHCGGNQFAVVWREHGEQFLPFDPERDGLNPCLRCYSENCVTCAQKGMRNSTPLRVIERHPKPTLRPTLRPTEPPKIPNSREFCC